MTALESALLGVIGVLLVLAIGYGLYRRAKLLGSLSGGVADVGAALERASATVEQAESRIQNIDRVMQASVTATESMVKAMAASREDTASVPKLVTGLTRACEAQVREYAKFRGLVETFRDTITVPPSDEAGGVQGYDPMDAELAFQRREFRANGDGEEEAILKAQNAAFKPEAAD